MTQYFSFSGKDNRPTYWAVLLITWFAGMFATILTIGGLGVGIEFESVGVSLSMGILLIAVLIVMVWLVIASVVRRLRDAGQNPLWVLVTFLPYVGFVAYIVFGCLPTEEAKEE